MADIPGSVRLLEPIELGEVANRTEEPLEDTSKLGMEGSAIRGDLGDPVTWDVGKALALVPIPVDMLFTGELVRFFMRVHLVLEIEGGRILALPRLLVLPPVLIRCGFSPPVELVLDWQVLPFW